ncbi:hypothetical protein BJ742DRAFT_601 [Cladochytrium replicatum]|nr:hypothetical protein BJ742DRAFT_601 [Cladochytrium replicatum]
MLELIHCGCRRGTFTFRLCASLGHVTRSLIAYCRAVNRSAIKYIREDTGCNINNNRCVYFLSATKAWCGTSTRITDQVLRDKDGRTALWYATCWGRVASLAARGANSGVCVGRSWCGHGRYNRRWVTQSEGECARTILFIPYVEGKTWTLWDCGSIWRNRRELCSELETMSMQQIAWGDHHCSMRVATCGAEINTTDMNEDTVLYFLAKIKKYNERFLCKTVVQTWSGYPCKRQDGKGCI